VSKELSTRRGSQRVGPNKVGYDVDLVSRAVQPSHTRLYTNSGHNTRIICVWNSPSLLRLALSTHTSTFWPVLDSQVGTTSLLPVSCAMVSACVGLTSQQTRLQRDGKGQEAPETNM
jgi:hypothetical protein